MKPTRLTDDEIKVVTNPKAGDFILLEIIKGMCVEELKTLMYINHCIANTMMLCGIT